MEAGWEIAVPPPGSRAAGTFGFDKTGLGAGLLGGPPPTGRAAGRGAELGLTGRSWSAGFQVDGAQGGGREGVEPQMIVQVRTMLLLLLRCPRYCCSPSLPSCSASCATACRVQSSETRTRAWQAQRCALCSAAPSAPCPSLTRTRCDVDSLRYALPHVTPRAHPQY